RADSSTEWTPSSGYIGLVDLRALGGLDEALDLLVGEAAELPRLRGDGDQHRVVLAVLPHPAEVEALVDGLLELDGPAPALRIALGELGEPLRAHAHVGDLVGEPEVPRPLQDGIAHLPGDVDELVEDVAGQALEAAVHARHPGGRVLRAGAAPEDGRLRELAHIAVEVLEEPEIDLQMAGLVPHLAGHVHGELPGRVGEIVDAAPRALHGLHLAHHDPVDPLLDGLAAAEIGERREPLLDLELRDIAGAHAAEGLLAGQLAVGDRGPAGYP